MAENKKVLPLPDRLVMEGINCRGYGIIPKAVMLAPAKDLSINAKGIYAFLAAMSGSGVTSYPSVEYICDCLQINKDTYYKHSKALKDQGYIVVTHMRADHSQYGRNEYTLAENPKGLTFDDAEEEGSWLYSQLVTEGIRFKGYGMLPRALMEDKRLSLRAKALMAYILSYAGAGKVAFPKVTKMCQDLGISKNNYQKLMREIQALGYLVIKQRNNTGKRGFGVNDYYIQYNPVEHDISRPQHKFSETVKPDTVEPETVESEPVNTDTVVSEPVEPETVNAEAIINSSSATNSSSAINIPLSINRAPQAPARREIDEMDSEREDFSPSIELYEEMIQENIGYDDIEVMHPSLDIGFVDACVLMMARACAGKGPVKIGGEEIPRKSLRKTLLSLDSEHLVYVADCLKEQSQKGKRIYNMKAYILACLYNAPTTMEIYYENKVAYDEAN